MGIVGAIVGPIIGAIGGVLTSSMCDMFRILLGDTYGWNGLTNYSTSNKN